MDTLSYMMVYTQNLDPKKQPKKWLDNSDLFYNSNNIHKKKFKLILEIILELCFHL